LKEGVTFEHIIDSIRDAEVTDDTHRRSLLLERKDLHNISRDFNIDYATKRHKNDAISIKLWVEEMKMLETQCPVLYYKSQDEDDWNGEEGILSKHDFVLILMTKFQQETLQKFGRDKICVDGTHGTNAYDIQLYTVVTVNEFGSGCPVAFCLSNRSDELIFQLFFEKIKFNVEVIDCKVFMTDDAPAFYNAWIAIMGPVEHRLLCTWHVDKNWRQNLSKISGGSEKKSIVYKTLRILLQTTSIEEFKNNLQNVIRDLKQDKDTYTFGVYFEKYYSKRPECWAYCYRLRLGINTNMYLESFHKVLKHIYLEGKRVKRLDKTINALNKYSRDSQYKRLIKLSKNIPTEKVQRVRQSHNSSKLIKLEQIQIVENKKVYIIKSLSNPSQQHYIIKTDETCTQSSCLKCKKCDICIHTFHCSCIDNVIKANICKHIHACAREFISLDGNTENTVFQDSNMTEQKTLMDMVATSSHHKAHKNQTIISQTQMILGLSSTNEYSNENLQKIEKKLAEVLAIMNEGGQTHLKTVEEVNVQRKIDPQLRLYSTKKKSSKTSIAKPSVNEVNAIISGLKDDNNETINVHNVFDHSYS